MSMTDPIADMLTRIRNAQTARKPSVTLPASKQKLAVAKVLEQEGYLASVDVRERRRQGHADARAEVLPGPARHRAHPAREPSGPAHLQARRRVARRAGRPRRRDRVDVAGRHDERSSQGAGSRRRSALHRPLITNRVTTMSRVGKKPVELGKDLSAEVKGQSVTIKGKKGSLTLETELRGRGHGRRQRREGRAALGQQLRQRDGRHDARAPREHGHGRHEGLREKARARRRRLPRRGAGQEAEPDARFLASRGVPDSRRASRSRRRARTRSS